MRKARSNVGDLFSIFLSAARAISAGERIFAHRLEAPVHGCRGMRIGSCKGNAYCLRRKPARGRHA